MFQTQRTTVQLCICFCIITICTIYTTQSCDFVPTHKFIKLPVCQPSKLEGEIQLNWTRYVENVCCLMLEPIFCDFQPILSSTNLDFPQSTLRKVKDGMFKPVLCRPEKGHSVAIIIPYRDPTNIRRGQLLILLHYMIPMLIRQNIKFAFFVINQSDDGFKGSTLFGQ